MQNLAMAPGATVDALAIPDLNGARDEASAAPAALSLSCHFRLGCNLRAASRGTTPMTRSMTCRQVKPYPAVFTPLCDSILWNVDWFIYAADSFLLIYRLIPRAVTALWFS